MSVLNGTVPNAGHSFSPEVKRSSHVSSSWELEPLEGTGERKKASVRLKIKLKLQRKKNIAF